MALAVVNCLHCQQPFQRQTVWPAWVCPHCQHLNVGAEATPIAEPEEDLCLPWVGTSLTLRGTSYNVLGRWQLLAEQSYRNLWMLSAGNQAHWLLEWNGRLVLLTNCSRQPRMFSSESEVPAASKMTRYQSDDYFIHSAEGELSVTELAPQTYHIYQGVDQRAVLIDVYADVCLEYSGYYINNRELDTASLRLGSSTPAEWKLPAEPELCTCPQCQHQIPVYTYTQAITIVCAKCGMASGWKNAHDNTLELQERQLKLKYFRQPPLPIGKQFQLRGVDYRVIGFVEQREKNTIYGWREYALFSQARGYAYLSEYDGHWNLFGELNGLPYTIISKTAKLDGITFKHLSRYRNTPEYAVGEFPYMVTETANFSDYVSPPYTLSVSNENGYQNWMHGEYIPIKEIRAFVHPQAAAPVGIAPAQPVGLFIPIKIAASVSAVAASVLLVLHLLLLAFFPSKQLASENVIPPDDTYFAERPGPTVVVPSGPMGLTGLDVTLNAPVDNYWMAVAVTFINQETGAEHLVDIEAEFYYGYSDGESWSEGGHLSKEVVTALPAGTYDTVFKVYEGSQKVSAYSIVIERSGPYFSNVIIGWILLAAIPLFLVAKENYMESQRWSSDD